MLDSRAVFINVLYPFLVVIEAIGGYTNNFDVAFRKIRGTTSDLSEFSGANGRKISGMRKQYCLAEIVKRLD
jgi:hypothetical protein